MIISISADGRYELLEADDFKKFKIVLDSDHIDGAPVETALSGMGRLDEDGAHAWIEPEAFLAREAEGRNAEWKTQFKAMVETAARYGFVDSASGAVRAHIELKH